MKCVHLGRRAEQCTAESCRGSWEASWEAAVVAPFPAAVAALPGHFREALIAGDCRAQSWEGPCRPSSPPPQKPGVA